MGEICMNCGGLNPKKNMKTCSRKCIDEFKKNKNKENRICLFCKSEFSVRKKDIKKICSERCRLEWNKIPENILFRTNKSKKAIKEKYGVDNVFQLESIKIKSQKTKKEKYGDENYNNLDKAKKTIKDKYGDDYYRQLSKKLKDKFLKKHGVSHHLKLPYFLEKIKQTNLFRYGVKNVSQIEEVKIKNKKKFFDKYGFENPSQSEEIKKKKKNTSISKFGVEHHLQNQEMFKKHFNSQFKILQYKDYNLYYQSSYEKYFLDLLEEKGLINEVKNGDSFKYFINDKEHIYHVDFKIREIQIEIKSRWTYNKNNKDIELQNINEIKWQTVRDLGYNLIVLIDKEEIENFIKTL